jgi:hypothetical protein
MMKRRQFLGAAAATAVIATWPRWLAEAFADQPACDPKQAPAPTGLAALSGAWSRAQAAGKPLLVIVIPNEGGERYRRGHALGELLNHGTPDQVAPLALVEVACASMADLKKLVPSAGEGEPLMVLVDTDRVPARAERLDTKVPDLPDEGFFEERPAKPLDPNVVIAERIAILARLVRGAIAPDAPTIARRAALARKKLAVEDRERIDAFLAKDTWLATELADRGAALLLDAAEARQLAETKSLALLRDVVRARLVVEPPAGAHWAISAGCGVDVEETAAERKQRELEEQQGLFNRVYVVVGCGMGHTPEKSQRFLYLFAKGETP